MKQTSKRLLSLLLVLMMVVSALPLTVLAADENTATYTKVTTNLDDWSGQYLLVYEAGDEKAYVFNGSLTTLDAANNYREYVISGGSIVADPGMSVTIEAVEGGYVLKTASEKYIYHSSDANKISTTENQSTAAKYPLTILVTADGVDLALSVGPRMRFNPTSDQMRFRFFKSSTYTKQEPVTLYKLSDGGSTTQKVSTPEILPKGGAVKEKTEITITCKTEGASIYYTVDGTAPTAESTAYTEPFSVEPTEGQPVTVKAIALKEGFENSGLAEETYTYSSLITIAEARNGGTGKQVTVEGVVINDYTSSISSLGCYIQDATGGIMLYDKKNLGEYKVGDVLRVTGTTAEYNGKFELTDVSVEKKSSDSAVTPESITIADFNTAAIAEAKEGTLVKLRNLTVTKVEPDSYKNVTLTLSSGEATMKAKLDSRRADTTGLAALKTGTVVNVVGIIESNGNNESHLLQLRTEADVTEASAIADPITDDMIGEGVLTVKEANQAAATNVTVIGQVVYHYGKAFNSAASIDSIILEDVIDGEIYGFQVYDYTNYTKYKVGDVVKVTGNIAAYGGVMQMKEPAMEVVKAGLDPIPAQEVTVSQLGADYLSEYVHIKDVTLGTYSASGNTAVTDSTGKINLFKGVPLPSGVKETDVTGLYACCSAYNGTYQLRNGAAADYENNVQPAGGLPETGDQVVIYNASAESVIGLEDDLGATMSAVPAKIEEGKAVVGNGGRVFTVTVDGNDYSFQSGGKYLAADDEENLFLAEALDDYAKWNLEKKTDGYVMNNKAAKYTFSNGGSATVCIEYFSGSFSGWTYKSADSAIFEFDFYPVAEGTTVTEGIVNVPSVVFGTLADAYLDQAYTFTFTVDAVFGVQELSVKVGESPVTVTKNEGVYTVTIPAEQVTGDELLITVSGKDGKDVEFTGTETVAVKDEPVISNLTPAAGSETGGNKCPEISADVANAGENPTVTMTVNDSPVKAAYADGKVTYTPAEDLADGRTTVTVTVKRADGKEATATWSFTVGEAQFQLYFGQLHSHTTYSDGSGSLDSALEYIQNLPDNANVDFAAFTDHSNYFDKSGAANPESALYDMSLASEYSQDLWAEYKSKVADFNASQNSVIALGGFEMTWSGGPGHINTFNTPGIVSRNNTTLNNKTDDAGMKAYYALLSQAEGADSLSQFNHPGSTFGTFSDFAYWDPVIDSRIFMVEVGNGEGQIGAGGYYPSYEYYTMALDKGWHVAPTNNQDNHKGKWGNANDARDVILTDDFTEQGLYEAIRNYRLYATEDKNLEIGYTVNDQMMGHIFAEIPKTLNINVTVNDPDASDSISKVEVIVNSGKVAHTWNDPAELARGSLSVELEPTYSYYYIRVTEGDGDLAVTAPVWVGESLKLGISSLECGTSTPVTGEELTLTTTLFNSETSEAKVKSITFTSGNEILGTDTTGYTVPASGTLAVDFTYTPTVAKVMTVKATVVMELDGKEYTFTKDIELDVLNADSLVYVGIDASHHNEYVAGNYKDSMGNFGNLAAGYSVRTVLLNTSEDLIAATTNVKYKMIILTAPSRRDGTALRNPYDTYSDEEIAALVQFNNAGGAVVLCGWGDYYESYASFPQEDHMSAQQNKILAALGSSLRISDDETKDNTWNGGQSQRLYLSSYNFDSFLLEGVEYDAENPHNNLYTELFSQYGGASIYAVDADGKATATVPGTVTPVVFGFDTTYSSDDDSDNYGSQGSIPKYTFDGAERLMIMATEQLDGKGLIVVSGAAFLSNFEVQATISDNGAEKNYSNYKICENLVQYINPVQITPIAEVQAQTEAGYKYTIEGVVTSNASGYDKDTAFFDCIYVQDETGGVCCFPVAGNFKIGDKVRVTGTTDFYQGEMELQVTSIEKIGDAEPVTPKKVTAAQVNNGSVLGQLITLKGTVVSFEKANGLVQTIMVKDENGNVARVFIDGYITTDKDVENLEVGCNITVTGLASYDNTFNAPEGPFPRIRIRNRADVVCTEADKPVAPVNPGKPSTPVAPAELPFRDVSKRDWFYQDVKYVYENGIMNGVSDQDFAPNQNLTRGMIVTILYRMENTPKARTAGTFTDVTAGQWYTDAVEWAAAHNIVNGYGNGKFGPNDPVTREQLAAILYRYAQYKSRDVSVGEDTNILSYTDAFSISEYAIPALQWACGEGLINGADGNLMPADHATRAQVAAIIHRYLEG